MSMENIEIMFKRLLKNTKAEICSETADLVASHVSSLSSEIASVRSELAVEHDERITQSDVVVSRVDGVMLRVGALESNNRVAQNLDLVARIRAGRPCNTIITGKFNRALGYVRGHFELLVVLDFSRVMQR